MYVEVLSVDCQATLNGLSRFSYSTADYHPQETLGRGLRNVAFPFAVFAPFSPEYATEYAYLLAYPSVFHM